MNKRTSQALFVTALVWLVVYLVITGLNLHTYAGWCLMLSLISLALALRRYELLKGYSFTIMVFAAVSLAMYYPQYFINVGDFKFSKLIIPFLQIIMFGMGTELSWKDFARVAQIPKAIGVGLFCQFSIMPFMGWAITKLFSFPPEVAAGIILMGSCPSGLASNVMSYLAKANLALSVTITAMATLLAPLLTPFFMHLLAGQYVEVHFIDMVLDITKIVLLPVIAGLIFNHFLHGKFKALDKMMPLLSMIGITLIIVVITAVGRDDLMTVGPLLILATLLHNMSGFFLGYWLSRLVRMKEADSRTVAIEVGLQNAGLASGLALHMGKLATVGLPAAVFGPLMNITGSTLALWWRSKPPEGKSDEDETEDRTTI